MSHDVTRAPSDEFSLRKIPLRIGETTVQVQVRQFGNSAVTLVNVHDDEQSSVDAAVSVLHQQGGRLVELLHGGKRRVVFTLKGREYSFDPNRIFSPAGVRLTIRGEAPIPSQAYRAVSRFAADFLRCLQLKNQPAFITLHNNSDGDFSIHSYQPGAQFEADTAQLYTNPESDPDDFYFVTDERTFRKLRERKLNVILQDNRIRRDDGSLSVYAGRRGMTYINVEAEPGHLPEQIRMIEIALETIGPQPDKR